jgi:hypothetical protein
METGHVNNVASLNTLISRCEGFGDRYNPTNPALTITNLKAIHTGANAELENVNATKPPYINAVSDRQIIFLDMEKLYYRRTGTHYSTTSTHYRRTGTHYSTTSTQYRRTDAHYSTTSTQYRRTGTQCRKNEAA